MPVPKIASPTLRLSILIIFIDREPFIIGDLVLVSGTQPDDSHTCLKCMVVGSNPDGTYNVECSANDELLLTVEKNELAYAEGDAFRFNCGEYSSRCMWPSSTLV
ncbi:unnamed protein product [Durusdinium trenchii]|uniref:Uncharacterized protein n=2 Tax=Durusdinium trenchii TaxID=1381693 RepID=A0ABP0K489_9DINO